MDSIYACAETSGGSSSIHPAFNGLGQFAGPGHWNDPDMLQVGNITDGSDAQKIMLNRTHFGLWCILASPLMAGTDLRSVKSEIKMILTAPEVIGVDQDKRGIQGYKVFSNGRIDVYNKQLSDGTTAVFMLNKGDLKANVNVTWDQIGLKGNQPVRDLWERKDLGKFRDLFSVELGKHESRLVKIGTRGRPLPAPKPVPSEKYMITRRGSTYLSDLYYIWKAGSIPAYDTAFGGDPILVGGKVMKRGLGAQGKTSVMFKLGGNANRFRAIVAVDRKSKAGGSARFRVYSGDFFSNKVLWDSGKLAVDSESKEIVIDVKSVDCLMLVFEGEQMFGNWGEARVEKL
jgi:alpha-galactosidase